MKDGTRSDGETGRQSLGKLSDVPAPCNALTEAVIGSAIEVHRHLGPGLLERLYVEALCYELREREIDHACEVPVRVRYKGIDLSGQRLDLVVDHAVVVEAKAIERVHDVHLAQLVSYLRSGGYPVGLLINFNVPVLKQGIYRRVNLNQSPRASAPFAFHPEGGAP